MKKISQCTFNLPLPVFVYRFKHLWQQRALSLQLGVTIWKLHVQVANPMYQQCFIWKVDFSPFYDDLSCSCGGFFELPFTERMSSYCVPLVSNQVPVWYFISMSPSFAFLLSPDRLAFIFILNSRQVILGFVGFHVCAIVTPPELYVENFGQSTLILLRYLVLYTMSRDSRSCKQISWDGGLNNRVLDNSCHIIGIGHIVLNAILTKMRAKATDLGSISTFRA